MISKELNIGRAGQYLVLADLLLRGVQAFTTGEGAGYDVIADTGDRLIRIQVKTTQKMRILNKHANPIYFFQIKRTGNYGNKFYKTGDFDVFALVGLDRKLIFYLPFNEKVKSNSICVRDREVLYTGKRGGGMPSGMYYQDLTWENCINADREYTYNQRRRSSRSKSCSGSKST